METKTTKKDQAPRLPTKDRAARALVHWLEVTALAEPKRVGGTPLMLDYCRARMASLIETCKQNAIDPCAYLHETLTAIANGHPASRINDLMPWAFQKPSS